MPGDYSRETFNRRKSYTGVRMQQGRVQLDADWNEEGDIQRYRIETEAIDVIGQCGVPLATNGFRLEPAEASRNLAILPGRIYVDGLLIELDEECTYTSQPYLPHPPFTTPSNPPSGSPPGSDLDLNLDDGIYVAYLDAWQREVTALDDREIREVALDGPDTTTRIQNVWQVKLVKVLEPGTGSPPPPTPTCKDSFPEYDDITAASTGTLKARTVPPKDEDNVCLLPPGTGYSGFENQLYRVEIHTGGTRNQATFKFSRNNASFESGINNINDDVITVSDLGKDEVLSFRIGQWVEIVDDESGLKGEPHPLAQIDSIDQATKEITVKTSVAGFAGLSGLKLRAWDQTGGDAKADGINADLANFIDLDSGVQVNFSAGQYHSGDYWLIPARTATGDIEWPRDDNDNPLAQPPKGIKHHYCRLALVDASRGSVDVMKDCRNLFPPLTELFHFFYVGGGGQEAMPGESLPCPLQVGLTNGQFPVAGGHVKFVLTDSSTGTLHAGRASGSSLIVKTNKRGVAECTWELGEVGRGRDGCMQVTASLLDANDKPFQPSIRFNASFSVASNVAYDPSKCEDLKKARTVQQAIDLLCRQKPREEQGIRIEKIVTLADNKVELINDTLVPVNRLQKGLLIACDRPLSAACFGGAPDNPPSGFSRGSVEEKPTCYVTLDLPYPLIPQDKTFWTGDNSSIQLGVIGFQPLILASRVEVGGKEIVWMPSSAAMDWLQKLLFQALVGRKVTDRVLAHLTLKGKFIFGDKRSSKLYLDGEAFGRERASQRVNLVFPTGDGRKGGDFDMWFWLTPAASSGIKLDVAVTGGAGIPRGIRGTVLDSTENPVKGATVTLTDKATGTTRNTVTDDKGTFEFNGLPPDSYKVVVTAGEDSAEETVPVTAVRG